MVGNNTIGMKGTADFLLGKKIGGGSEGTVYEVITNEGLPTGECVKIIDTKKRLKADDEDMKERVGGLLSSALISGRHKLIRMQSLQEAKMMEELRGEAHIVQMVGFTCEQEKDGPAWRTAIRMERLTCLKEEMEEHLFTMQEVCRIGQDLCEALEACRRRGIVHQDIKPANVFVTDDGKYKLGDFGIAKKENASGILAEAMSSGGSMITASPEALRGEGTDHRSDLYSLGLLLYLLLNDGLDPFMPAMEEVTDEKRIYALQRRLAGEKLPAAHCCGSADLAGVLERACAVDPDERYQTAEEMMEALSRISL